MPLLACRAGSRQCIFEISFNYCTKRVRSGRLKFFKLTLYQGPREDEIDWWSKFFASTGESAKDSVYLETGMDLIKVSKTLLTLVGF